MWSDHISDVQCTYVDCNNGFEVWVAAKQTSIATLKTKTCSSHSSPLQHFTC